MSVIINHNSNNFKPFKLHTSIQLNQEKVPCSEKPRNDLSICDKPLDKLNNGISKKTQDNLLILNFLANASEKNFSEKTALTDSYPENFDYDLTMINKFDEDINTSLSFVSDFDLEKDEDKSFSSFESENDDDSFEKIEIKAKYNKKVDCNKNSNDEVNDKLNKEFLEIKNSLLCHEE